MASSTTASSFGDPEIGTPVPARRAEWKIYRDPFAKAVAKVVVQVTVKDLCKINASLPDRYGELEFFDFEAFVDYLHMPQHLREMDQRVQELEATIQQLRYKNEQQN
jgi:hypothetical protein